MIVHSGMKLACLGRLQARWLLDSEQLLPFALEFVAFMPVRHVIRRRQRSRQIGNDFQITDQSSQFQYWST